MLRRDEGDVWLVITQPEHAALSGRLAEQWAVRPEPWRETLLAIYEHDNGHQYLDANGNWNPETGEVIDFRTAPQEQREGIITRGVSRLAQEHPYAALLVATHFRAPSLRDPLFARLQGSVTREQVDASYQIVQACDTLSLAVCFGVERFASLRDTPALRPAGQPLFEAMMRTSDGTTVLDPWPFSLPVVTAHVSARVIPARRYESTGALAEAFHTAALRDITVTFVPAR